MKKLVAFALVAAVGLPIFAQDTEGQKSEEERARSREEYKR